MDKLTEMKAKEQQLNGDSQDIEKEFMQSFWEEINKFHMDSAANQDETNENQPSTEPIHNANKVDDLNSLFNDFSGNMDALLSMAFDSYTTITSDNSFEQTKHAENSIDCYGIYTRCAYLHFFSF